ncbi:hypothetical protein D9758_002483 [Tetrapyrgos nigripes]|uniref:Uncharacterized protein n=1 Tax=Tetrapyrgos nigripes TaxID=182062 RepID=A0A8H5GRH2_9AGAR|nr:hypothetical protein D9758_002483 [Tetrapyrgos nigripes]
MLPGGLSSPSHIDGPSYESFFGSGLNLQTEYNAFFAFATRPQISLSGLSCPAPLEPQNNSFYAPSYRANAPPRSLSALLSSPHSPIPPPLSPMRTDQITVVLPILLQLISWALVLPPAFLEHLFDHLHSNRQTLLPFFSFVPKSLLCADLLPIVSKVQGRDVTAHVEDQCQDIFVRPGPSSISHKSLTVHAWPVNSFSPFYNSRLLCLMRLLNTKTLKLKEFYADIPQYAILSHTWEKEEVIFQDIQNLRTAKLKAGYDKVWSAYILSVLMMVQQDLENVRCSEEDIVVGRGSGKTGADAFFEFVGHD